MSKVSARWVPRLLTPDQKFTRLVMSEVNLARFEANPDRLVERFLTQDECWVHHFEPDQKAIHAVEALNFSCSKEGQGSVIRRKSDGLPILGCKRHCVHRLPSEK